MNEQNIKNHHRYDDYPEDRDGLTYDPKERDPKFKAIIKKAEKEAEENLKDKPRTLGFCRMLWEEKKRIIKKKYGIDWKTPAELNPDVIFD